MSNSVGIVATTYMPEGDRGLSRLDAYKEAIKTWKEHIKYSGETFLVISDDGSNEENLKQAISISSPDFPTSVSIQPRHGVGASLNNGFRIAFYQSDIAMYMVDDWGLYEDFDITPWVKLLEDNLDIGMVRLGPPHPGLTGTIEHHYGSWILRCNRHNFVYGMRPALYHRRFFDAYGKFDEDCSSIRCEAQYNEKFCTTYGPDIVVAIPHPWYIIDNVELGYLNPITERDE